MAGAWLGEDGGGDDGAAGLVAPGQVSVRGRVVSDPDRIGTSYRLRLSDLEALIPRDHGPGRAPPWRPVTGTVLVTARATPGLAVDQSAPHFRYGDILRLEGTVQEPPVFPDFDHRDYLAHQGIRSVMAFPEPALAVISVGADNRSGHPRTRG